MLSNSLIYAIIAIISHIFMLRSDMIGKGSLPISNIFTLVTMMLHPFMYNKNVFLQTSLICSLIFTLIAHIFSDAFVCSCFEFTRLTTYAILPCSHCRGWARYSLQLAICSHWSQQRSDSGCFIRMWLFRSFATVTLISHSLHGYSTPSCIILRWLASLCRRAVDHSHWSHKNFNTKCIVCLCLNRSPGVALCLYRSQHNQTEFLNVWFAYVWVEIRPELLHAHIGHKYTAFPHAYFECVGPDHSSKHQCSHIDHNNTSIHHV